MRDRGGILTGFASQIAGCLSYVLRNLFPPPIPVFDARVGRARWIFRLSMAVVFAAGLLTAPGAPLPKGLTFKNALLPVYARHELEPCGFIKVEHLYHDYQTRGFFRIGLLPTVRAEKVEFIIADAGRFREFLAEVRPLLLSDNSCRSFEMHRVTVRVDGEAAPRLEAARIRLTESGDWDLVEGGELRVGEITRTLPRSRLTVSGPEAGSLHTSLDGRLKTFQLLESTKPTEHKSE